MPSGWTRTRSSLRRIAGRYRWTPNRSTWSWIQSPNMPFSNREWQEDIKGVEREYVAARYALRRTQAQVDAAPDILAQNDPARKELRAAVDHLEGTYVVRLFAAFEAAPFVLQGFVRDRGRRLDDDRTDRLPS